jgi:hypothetical protein
MSRGRRAALPPKGPRGDEPMRAPALLILTLTLEDDPNYRFDVSHLAGPELVRAELGAAVVAWTTSANGGRRIAAIKSKRYSMSAFLKWLEHCNQEQLDGKDEPIRSLADVTPFHLRRYLLYLKKKYAPHTVHDYYSDIIVLLKRSNAVSKETKREAGKRKRTEVPPTRPVQRYPHKEFVELRNAARRIVQAAHGRITTAYALAQQYEDPQCPDRVRAGALRDVIAHGKPQTREGLSALERTVTATGVGKGEKAAHHHLFLSADEAFAAGVLLACQRGLNLSPIVTAPAPTEHEPGVLQLNLDKPRRGPNERFWPEIIFDAENSVGDDTGATTVQMIAEATHPAREYLSAQGEPADRLMIYWPGFRDAPQYGIPQRGTRKKAAWVPAGISVDFRRLRRSVPDQGAAKEPTDHSPDTHLHYVRTDPVSLMEQREQAALGVQKLIDHARASLAIRARADLDTDPNNDAVLVNCSDPLNQPETRTPCTSGFYSFLDCLGCRNAATVPRLLPRQMAALRVLEELRDGIGATWERRFASHYYTLVALIDRHTPAEREAAAPLAGQHIAAIVAALRHEVPA